MSLDYNALNRRITEVAACVSRGNALMEAERLQRIEMLNRLVRMESRLVQIMLALNVEPRARKEPACTQSVTE
jgi:hypothetical protein